MPEQADFDKELLEEIDELCDHIEGIYYSILGWAEEIREYSDDMVRRAEEIKKESKTLEIFDAYLSNKIRNINYGTVSFDED